MTINANLATAVGDNLPSGDDRAAADRLREVLAARHEDGGTRVAYVDPQTKETAEITLSPMLAKVMLDLLRHISRGEAVTLVPYGQKLTTQQAADILNVSRPHLVKLLEQDRIAFELVGRHRRIAAADLFAYKARRDSERERQLAELMASDADLI